MAQESATNHSVEQAECESCGEASFEINDKEMDMERDGIVYDVECGGCGETGRIAIGENGVASTDEITHENATWNQSGEEDSSDE